MIKRILTANIELWRVENVNPARKIAGRPGMTDQYVEAARPERDTIRE